MNKSYLSETINAAQLLYVPSFQFTLFISKSIMEEFIPIIMSNLNVSVFGYIKSEDKYWGKIGITKSKQPTVFNLSFVKIKEKETKCVISIFNATLEYSQKIAENIFAKMQGIETSKLIYRISVNDS